MPQRRSLKSQRGAALAAVLGISLLLGLSGGGYLMVVGSAAKDESESYQQDRAFQAAESGLLLGTRWLRTLSALPTSTQSNVLGTQTINGMSVTVNVVVDAGNVYVESNSTGVDLPYTKRLRWRVTRNTPGSSGTFVDGMAPARGGHGIAGQGLNNVTIDGPFHANEAIIISSVAQGESEVRFVNGRVSTHNSTTTTTPGSRFTHTDPYNTGDYGQYGDGSINNYDFGVWKHDLHNQQGSNQGAALDQIFTQSFNHSQERLILGASGTPDVTLQGSAPDGVGNNRPDDETVARRSTLIFNSDGTADYYWWSKVGNGPNATWSVFDTTIQIVDGKHFLVQSDVNVLGTVKGKTTVQTPDGYSIFTVGELVYDGFSRPLSDDPFTNFDNTGNYGIGTSNPNVLGLISGADLYFASQWKDPREGSNPAVKDVVGDANKNMYVQAIAIAANSGKTNMWNTIGNNGRINLSAYKYNLRFIGSRTLDNWFNYTSGGQNANSSINFYYDTRLSTLTAPGLPDVYADGGNTNLLSLTLHDWEEFNVGS